ncbi:MAG: sodium:alanine symporter family protein [Lachnospiraceae bacterium]|nr:sodium:alanine symporter family protein [Lachnospiraceae bacterium]
METIANILSVVDDFVWGPVMLVLLVGTGIFLTVRTRFLGLRNLGYALKSGLGKEARTTKKGEGDISPFSALTTALAATIGTGNIVGVATAMVSGGPGALIWMWLSAFFGLTSKFSECMLAIKYREVNEAGEMSGGPMYTMKKAFKHKKLGTVLGWFFALFAVIASFGIGNMTQANSISTAVNSTFGVPIWLLGIIITVLALFIIVGGIKSISKVSQVVVPLMAVFYMIGGLVVIIINYKNLPAGVVMIVKMAFSPTAIGGGLCGSITAAMMNALRYGVARGVFSNEAGMGSAAITAAAATTDNPVRQGYINMTGTFWDTIVVCTITGLCIASSGMLGQVQSTPDSVGSYSMSGTMIDYTESQIGGCTLTDSEGVKTVYRITPKDGALVLTPVVPNTDGKTDTDGTVMTLTAKDGASMNELSGTYQDTDFNEYKFLEDGKYEYYPLLTGSALTIAAFGSALGKVGGWLVCIGIALFAFSTILGWEYHGEKAFEYLFGTHKYNIIYRVVFSLIAYIGATTTLQVVWNFSDIANALMAIPNLICLLALSGVIAKDMKEFQQVIKAEKKQK